MATTFPSSSPEPITQSIPFFRAPGKLKPVLRGRDQDGATVGESLSPPPHALGRATHLDVRIEVRQISKAVPQDQFHARRRRGGGSLQEGQVARVRLQTAADGQNPHCHVRA